MERLPKELNKHIESFLRPWIDGSVHPTAKAIKDYLKDFDKFDVKILGFCRLEWCEECGEWKPEPDSVCNCDYQDTYLNFPKNNWYTPHKEYLKIINRFKNHPYFDSICVVPPYLMTEEKNFIDMCFISGCIFQKMRKSVWENGRPEKNFMTLEFFEFDD